MANCVRNISLRSRTNSHGMKEFVRAMDETERRNFLKFLSEPSETTLFVAGDNSSVCTREWNAFERTYF